jgi:hypothetical protein
LIVGAAGGIVLETTAWAMIGGVTLGIVSILLTGISKAAIYGAFLGAPLGAFLGFLLGLRIETMPSTNPDGRSHQ